MTLDQIDRMVRQANPVPDLNALEPGDAPVLSLDQLRRTEMQTHDQLMVEEGPKPPGQGLWLGIAAAAAIVIGALLLLPLGNEAPVADQPATSPVEIATAFVEAYGNFDVDTAATLLSSDADLTRLHGGRENWRLANRLLEAHGFKLLLDSCEESGSLPASGTAVRCTWDFHGIRSDEIGLGPFSGSAFDLDVLDGRIVAVAVRWGLAEFSPQVWEPFAAWVAETYPDDAVAMYEAGMNDFLYTEESIALWEQRSREYVEVVKAVAIATGFVEAYAAFDVDQAASYLAADADLFRENVEQMRLENRLLQANGFKLLFDSCEERMTSPLGVVVRCLWDFHAIRSDEIGLGPFTGSSFALTVREGEIVAASMQWDIEEFSPQMWEPFAAWVIETYPDDVAVMYTPGLSAFQLTEESIALWEQRSREYVEVAGG